jgi:hypothetical protein
MRGFRRPHAAGVNVAATMEGVGSQVRSLDGEAGEAAEAVVVALYASVGWEAVEWAAAEAGARQSGLRIVSFVNYRIWNLAGDLLSNLWDDKLQQAGVRLVRQAAHRAWAVCSSLDVGAYLRLRAPIATIIREDDDAALIVLDLGPTRNQRRCRSLAKVVAGHAGCPIALVSLIEEPANSSLAGQVVVGVDRGGEVAETIEFAFRAASRRGVGVTVLWTRGRDSIHLRSQVEEALWVWETALPEVEVRRACVALPIGRALATESLGAALVVLGVRPKRRPQRTSYRSVLAVLRSCKCPVAIVRKSRQLNGPRDDLGAYPIPG